ncbi:MAG TPA: DUF4328 domain-containing protein [Actinomycetota bacterium]|nr:DUF4328 domain-containing protein [Actinomycetota bacterium]
MLSLLGLNALLSVVVVGLRLAERGLLRRAARGDVVTIEEATRNDDRIAVVAGIGLGVLVVTGILWVVWQHRAQANLHAIGVPALRFSPGWAVGWWFVPFANLVKPFQTMRELWKASGGRPDWPHLPTWPVIGWWWAGWITAAVLARVGAGLISSDSRSIEPFLAGNLWLTIAELVEIAAAMLAIALIRSVTDRQAMLKRHLDADAAVPPRPDLPALSG